MQKAERLTGPLVNLKLTGAKPAAFNGGGVKTSAPWHRIPRLKNAKLCRKRSGVFPFVRGTPQNGAPFCCCFFCFPFTFTRTRGGLRRHTPRASEAPLYMRSETLLKLLDDMEGAGMIQLDADTSESRERQREPAVIKPCAEN